MMAKAAYGAGLKNAVSIETEAILGYLMIKVFHDMLLVTMSRKIGQELIMHEICVGKGKLYRKSGEPQVYYVSKRLIAVSKQVVRIKERACVLAYGFTRIPTRLPEVSDKAKRYDVELCMNNNLKKLLLHKKENQINREVLAQIYQGEMFGVSSKPLWIFNILTIS